MTPTRTRKRARTASDPSRRSSPGRSKSGSGTFDVFKLPRPPGAADSRRRRKLPGSAELRTRLRALQVGKPKLTALERKGMELAALVHEQEMHSSRVGALERRILRLAKEINGGKASTGGASD